MLGSFVTAQTVIALRDNTPLRTDNGNGGVEWAVEVLAGQKLELLDTERVLENISGQLLPRIWTQGNTKCIASQPNGEHIAVLFYNKCLDAKDNYFYAKQLDLQLKEIF